MDNNLTKTELQTNQETLKHIENVRGFITLFCDLIRTRGINHDKSKLEKPELEYFAKYTPRLADSTYGSDEYNQCLEDMKPALEHHYAKNRHHPEHFPNGVDDMNLVDILEMLADWKAATLRHHDGNILKSIENNEKRFSISPQLIKILRNTVELFEHVEK